MYRILSAAILIAAFLVGGCSNSSTADRTPKGVVRALVIGGMVKTGLWAEMTKLFEAHTGYKMKTVASGQRPYLAKMMREGKADVLTMHSGDITTDVVAGGYAVNMRPWTHNDIVIIGPTSDPAGIKGMKDGAAAFRQIAEKKANFVDFRSIGPREVYHKLWHTAGVTPEGPWVLKDESGDHLNIATFAKAHNAYTIIGRMPILLGKVKSEGMEIMVQGDPSMQRPYVVMEANPEKFPNANHAGARALSDFLVSDKVQTVLAEFKAAQYDGIPLFHPLKCRQAGGK